MSEIEWLDADGRTLAAAPPADRRATGSPRLQLRSVALWIEVGWAVTAVLAVYGPFLSVYKLRIEQANTQQVDGWGRFDAAVNVAEGSGAHGIRFGIVSSVAAALILLALAARHARGARGRAGADAVTVLVRFVAVGLLIATSALVFLDVDALFDSVRSELSRFAVGQTHPALHIGPGAWMLLASAALGLVTAMLDVLSTVRAWRSLLVSPGQPERPDDSPPLAADHESL